MSIGRGIYVGPIIGRCLDSLTGLTITGDQRMDEVLRQRAGPHSLLYGALRVSTTPVGYGSEVLI